MPDPSGPENDAEGPFPVDPRDLIRHARAIANDLPGRGDTDYRRAVSAAFYALYHALTLAAAPHMTVSADPLEPYQRIRGIRHRHVRAAAEEARTGSDEQARMVARVTLRLYKWREDADYSHLVHFAPKDANDAVGIAMLAVEAVMGGGGTALARRLAALTGAP